MLLEENPGKTLYHGTTNNHRQSIEEYGLLPIVGDFVSDSYGMEYAIEGGEYEEDEPIIKGVVFAADKEGISMAAGAILYHVGKLLDKGMHDVTQQEVEQHGMLVIIKDVEPTSLTYGVEEGEWHQWPKEEKDVPYYAEQPPAVEPGDWFVLGEDVSIEGDVILTGRKMVQFLRRHAAFRHFEWDDRRYLIKLAVTFHGPEYREQCIAVISDLPTNALQSKIQWYETAIREGIEEADHHAPR
jgi:hypothetical protein